MCPRFESQQHLQARGRGSVGNVAVARVWRTSQTAHAIKHEKSKPFHIVCGMERANVAVARVSCILRCSAAVEAKSRDLCCARVSRIFSAEIAIKHEKNRVSEPPQIRAPVETLARGLKIYAIDCLTRHSGQVCRGGSRGLRLRAKPIPPRQGGKA